MPIKFWLTLKESLEELLSLSKTHNDEETVMYDTAAGQSGTGSK